MLELTNYYSRGYSALRSEREHFAHRRTRCSTRGETFQVSRYQGMLSEFIRRGFHGIRSRVVELIHK